MDETDPYRIAFEREKNARKAAEKLLDEKTREVQNSMLLAQYQYDDLLEKKKELDLLISLASVTENYRSFSEGVKFYIERISELFDGCYATVYLCDDKDRNPLEGKPIDFCQDEKYLTLLETFRLPSNGFSESITEKVMSGKRAITIPIDDFGENRQKLYAPYSIEQVTLIPIFRHNQIVAIVELGQSSECRSQERFLDTAVTASYQLSVMLERREAEKKRDSNYLALQEAHQELKAAQSQLVQSEKMASLGQLAAGVAHEINNPVGFVLSNLETLQEYFNSIGSILQHYKKLVPALSSGDLYLARTLLSDCIEIEDQEDCDFILKDSESIFKDGLEGLSRVKEIVASLKSFARADDGDTQHTNICEVMDKTIKVVWNELKYKVSLRKEYNSLPLIHCNAGEIGQVLMNLLINAAQSIDEKGEIVVSGVEEKGEIVIQVKDNGCGIPYEIQSRIFDPFFTTKPVNVGTGLGLSISYGIIEKHGGVITLDSKVGEGSCFTIRLPCA